MSTQAPEGMARMQGPENCNGCSWDGQEYPADTAGVVIVPMAAVRTLEGMGFTVLHANNFA